MPQSDTAKRIEEEEGRIRWVYPDSEGFLTIGVGTLVDKRKGGSLRDVEIDFIFQNRLTECAVELTHNFPWFTGLSEVRQGALTSMAFQLGIDGLLKFTHFLAFMAAGDYDNAATACLDSKWAKQTPSRAKRISEEIRTGVWHWRNSETQAKWK